jgi:hypothetical protein
MWHLEKIIEMNREEASPQREDTQSSEESLDELYLELLEAKKKLEEVLEKLRKLNS